MAVDINITGQYKVNGVPIGGASNPSLITRSTTNGTTVTGTTNNTLSQSLLIPANTFTGNGFLDIAARATKSGTGGNLTIRLYINTSNTLTAATLIGTLNVSNNGFYQAIRTFLIQGNTIFGFDSSTSATNDNITTGTQSQNTFTISVDNYLIFALQLVSATDSSVIRMTRAVKYI